MEKAGLVYTSLIHNVSLPDKFTIDITVWILLGIFIVLDRILYNTRADVLFEKTSFAVRWVVYTAMIFAIMALGGVENIPFIYFQF